MKVIHITELELIARLLATVALCALIGIERESRDQAAGLRTHVLVGVGAALFTLVSAYGFSEFQRPTANGTMSMVDPTRIAAQVVAGIGFLGAGAIIRQGISIRGLTTAAALWISAAVGMACAAGFYLGALVTTAIVLTSLIGFRAIRPRLMERIRTDYVVLDLSTTSRVRLGEVMILLGQHGCSVENMNSQHEEDLHSFQLELRVPPHVDLEPLLISIRGLGDIVDVAASGMRGAIEAED